MKSLHTRLGQALSYASAVSSQATDPMNPTHHQEECSVLLLHSKRHIIEQCNQLLNLKCEVPNPRHIVDIRLALVELAMKEWK